jgi:plasmid stability protein
LNLLQGGGMTELPKRITVKVSEELHRKVKIKAAVVGKSVSDVLREYLEAWVEEDPPKSEEKEP